MFQNQFQCAKNHVFLDSLYIHGNFLWLSYFTEGKLGIIFMVQFFTDHLFHVRHYSNLEEIQQIKIYKLTMKYMNFTSITKYTVIQTIVVVMYVCTYVFYVVIVVNLLSYLTSRLLLTLVAGQLLALLLSGTGVFSQLLEHDYGINTPTTQVFFMYFLLALTFTPYLAAFREDFEKTLRAHGWKYGLLALLDVEGNYCFVLAYQYTSLTSIQVLCITLYH